MPSAEAPPRLVDSCATLGDRKQTERLAMAQPAASVNDKNWKDLIRPNRPVVEHDHDAQRNAKLSSSRSSAASARRSGNALRRVLLSSLQGAAITGVQIDGVVHEFSSIPGVREDVTDIVLNLKRVAIRMVSETSKRMMLKASGAGPVKAGQIEDFGRRRDPQPRPRDLHAGRGCGTAHGIHGRYRQGLCPGRPQPSGRCAARLHPD